MKLCFVLGTRPEIIKLSPLIHECDKRKLSYFVIHTNQHYDKTMDYIFFEELKLKEPLYHLHTPKTSSHAAMTGYMLTHIEPILLQEKPDIVIVQGDTNSALAGALTASKLQIKIAHVEAGLRSHDSTMPEEINRILIDHISFFLFAPTHVQERILLQEGIGNNNIFITGNSIVDAIQTNLTIAQGQEKVKKYDDYILFSLHRPSNVDSKEILEEIIYTISLISQKYKLPIIFPVHPRTKESIKKYNISIKKETIEVKPPLGYLEMILLEKYAKLIITDSGGIQEEACILKVPCITLRNNTERPETIQVGANILVGNTKEKILDGVNNMINKKNNWKNPFGDGKTAKRIIDIFLKHD